MTKKGHKIRKDSERQIFSSDVSKRKNDWQRQSN